MEIIKATSDTVACTLNADEHDQVRAAWQALFRSALIAREDVAGGIRLTFAPAAKTELKRLIAIESECCGWVTFALDGPIVTMTADGIGEEAIREMWVPEK
jgi:hypothetical protein